MNRSSAIFLVLVSLTVTLRGQSRKGTRIEFPQLNGGAIIATEAAATIRTAKVSLLSR